MALPSTEPVGARSAPRVVLVADFDEALHAHNALRRRALERLGCAVAVVNPLDRGGLLDRLRGLSLQERIRRALAHHAPDFALVIEGGVLTAPMVAALKRETSCTWVNWFPSDLRGITLLEQVSPAYDRIFVAGTDVARRLAPVAPTPPRYLPLGCDPSVHRPMRARDQFRANVVFAGTATPRREQLLAELVEFGLALWGPGWRKTTLHDYCRGERLSAADYVRAYAGASVAVNVHHTTEGATDETACNQRTFELAAIGVPQVVDDRADLHRHFARDREVFVFRSGAELKALVQEALHDLAAAQQVAAAARRRALAEHTYMHRMRELLQSVTGAAVDATKS